MFEEIIPPIRRFVEENVNSGRFEEVHYLKLPKWEKGRDIIMRKDLAYELGKHNSALLLMWEKAKNRVYLPVNGDGSLAVIIISDAKVSNEYECFRAMRDSFYGLALKGVTIRSLPSQMRVWLRVGKEADRNGFSLGILGRAVVESMNSLDFVRATDVIILTSKSDMRVLNEQFSRGRRITEALIKMHEEEILNCEECDYRDVCSEIPELKRIRDRIVKRSRI
jgi:hypothetical protein